MICNLGDPMILRHPVNESRHTIWFFFTISVWERVKYTAHAPLQVHYYVPILFKYSKVQHGMGWLRVVGSLKSYVFKLYGLFWCVYMFIDLYMYIYYIHQKRLVWGWLRVVGSFKLYVSLAEYRLFYRALLQKRPIILRSLPIVATPCAHLFKCTVMSPRLHMCVCAYCDMCVHVCIVLSPTQ